MRRPHLTAAGQHDECGAAHNSGAGLSVLGGGGAGRERESGPFMGTD